MGDQNEDDKAVELWKVKNLIKTLEAARGNGTSMISLILPVSRRVAARNWSIDDCFTLYHPQQKLDWLLRMFQISWKIEAKFMMTLGWNDIIGAANEQVSLRIEFEQCLLILIGLLMECFTCML